MSNTPNTGYFISLEGGEGAGKTSQINKLAQAITAQGRRVVTTREPGGTQEAESIRNLLVQRDGGDWNPMAETLLLFAARAMHIEKIIKPALNDGCVVICDRFTDSTMAYQGYGRGLDIEKIREIERVSIDGFAPDLTFILDLDVRTGLERSYKRLASEKGYDKTEDRFERMDLSFHEKLREGFLDIARKNDDRCYILNAAQDIDNIAVEIQNIALSKLQAL